MEKKTKDHKRKGYVPNLKYLCFWKLWKEPRPKGVSTSPRKIDSFSLDTEKDEKSNKKLTVERGSRKTDINHTESEQDSTKVVPKFGDWCEDEPVGADGLAHIFNKVREERRGDLNDEFHRIKTFDLRGVKSGGRDKDQRVGPRFFQ